MYFLLWIGIWGDRRVQQQHGFMTAGWVVGGRCGHAGVLRNLEANATPLVLTAGQGALSFPLPLERRNTQINRDLYMLLQTPNGSRTHNVSMDGPHVGGRRDSDRRQLSGHLLRFSTKTL